MVSAGDPSGDRIGADLLAALRARGVSFDAAGIGGPRLRAAGLRTVASTESIAVMGFADIWSHLPAIRHARRELRRLLERHPDALFLPIDAPGLHMGLCRVARRMGRRIVYYVCPQIWAWGRGRTRALRRDVDLMLLLFRFETELMARERIPARWVGHPAGSLRPDPSLRNAARQALGLGSKETLLALLPGSRRDEVRRHLALMLDAAARLVAQSGGQVRVAVSDTGHLETTMRRGSARTLWNTLVPLAWRGDSRDLLRASDLAAVASGTATLETAALGVPQVIVYRTGWLNFEIARRIVRVPSIGLANLVAGTRAAPELIQARATGSRIATELGKLLAEPGPRDAQLQAFARIPDLLGGEGSAERAADALIEFVRAGGAA